MAASAYAKRLHIKRMGKPIMSATQTVFDPIAFKETTRQQ